MKKINALVSAPLALVLAVPASAHHSFAAYDMAKTLTAQVTIKEARWGAPHSSVVVMWKDPKGTLRQLTLISAFPAAFAKQGIKVKDIRSGDKVDIAWHPNRNGSDGGALARLTLANGKVFHDAEFFGTTQPAPAPSN